MKFVGADTFDYVEQAVRGYVECAFWTDTDRDSDTYDAESGNGPTFRDLSADWDDIQHDDQHRLVAFVSTFVADNVGPIRALDMDAAQLGHDLWLTRNGHGAGFWDRGYGTLGDDLSEAAKVYGEASFFRVGGFIRLEWG